MVASSCSCPSPDPAAKLHSSKILSFAAGSGDGQEQLEATIKMLRNYGFDNPDIVKILSFTAGSGDGQEQLARSYYDSSTTIKSKARDMYKH